MKPIDADALMDTIIQKSYPVTDYWNTLIKSQNFLMGRAQGQAAEKPLYHTHRHFVN